MKVSRNWLKTFFEKDIPTSAELTELFTFHAFEVEGVEHDVLDLKILPDRAHYCLSHRGIAEEIYVTTGQELKTPRDFPKSIQSNQSIAVVSVQIKVPQFCRRYVARRIEGVHVVDSPDWIRTHLTDIGERSINVVVDALNFIMFDVGQPLHAFDADKVQGSIVVRAAQEGEKMTLLDGKEVVLMSSDYVIADEVGPLAIAGVKGGKRAEITKDTKNLIIESANFDPTAVRRTATRLNLRNESSKRFENEITPELASDAMDMVSALIGALVPTSASSMSNIFDVYPVKPTQTSIKVTRAYVNDRLGIEVPEKIYNEIITRLGITTSPTLTGTTTIDDTRSLNIPYHRLDLVIPDDIVEEVGRVYGYDKIKSGPPGPATQAIVVAPIFYLSEKIKNILTFTSFSEVFLYTLVSKGEVATAYPLASDKSFARANLTDGMLISLEKNALNAELLGLEAIKIFEIGRTFTTILESTKLSIGVTQIKKIKGVKSDTVLVVAVETLAKELGVIIPSPKIITKGNNSVVEIDLDTLVSSYQMSSSATYSELGFGPAAKTTYKKFSPYPFIVRDIAVFTPENITAENVWSVVEKGIESAQSMPLLARHALFDTFQKDGRISYAFRMVFQSNEKTLTDTEIAAVMEQINAQMKASSWEVR